jgi:hypothetical protein
MWIHSERIAAVRTVVGTERVVRCFLPCRPRTTRKAP